jgi:hypothetical protein
MCNVLQSGERMKKKLISLDMAHIVELLHHSNFIMVLLGT